MALVFVTCASFGIAFIIRTHALEEGTSLEMLPERLRTEIAIHVHLDTLRKVCVQYYDRNIVIMIITIQRGQTTI